METVLLKFIALKMIEVNKAINEGNIFDMSENDAEFFPEEVVESGFSGGRIIGASSASEIAYIHLSLESVTNHLMLFSLLGILPFKSFGFKVFRRYMTSYIDFRETAHR